MYNLYYIVLMINNVLTKMALVMQNIKQVWEQYADI